MKAMFKNCR